MGFAGEFGVAALAADIAITAPPNRRLGRQVKPIGVVLL